jgi:hypothetical protein
MWGWLLRRLVAAVATSNLAASASGSVLVLLVVDELGANEATFGFVLATGSIGGLVGSFVVERVVAWFGRPATLITAACLDVIAHLSYVIAPSVVAAGAISGLYSLVVVLFNVPSRAAIQQATPTRLLGRVIATARVLAFSNVPVGAAIAGVVATTTGVRTAFLAAACASLLAAVATTRAVRHLPMPGSLT